MKKSILFRTFSLLLIITFSINSSIPPGYSAQDYLRPTATKLTRKTPRPKILTPTVAVLPDDRDAMVESMRQVFHDLNGLINRLDRTCSVIEQSENNSNNLDVISIIRKSCHRIADTATQVRYVKADIPKNMQEFIKHSRSLMIVVDSDTIGMLKEGFIRAFAGSVKDKNELMFMAWIFECNCLAIDMLLKSILDPKQELIESVDIHRLIDITAGIEIEQYELGLTKQYAGEKLYLKVNEGAILRVLMNLFKNARQAIMSQHGSVDIRTVADKDSVSIIISDTGIGMPQAAVDRYNDDPAAGITSSKGEGRGIGTATIKKFVKNMGGTITLESRQIKDNPENHGTTFTITLPRAEAPRASSAGSAIRKEIERLTPLYGGKGAGLLVLKRLGKKYGFEVPYFEILETSVFDTYQEHKFMQEANVIEKHQEVIAKAFVKAFKGLRSRKRKEAAMRKLEKGKLAFLLKALSIDRLEDMFRFRDPYDDSFQWSLADGAEHFILNELRNECFTRQDKVRFSSKIKSEIAKKSGKFRGKIKVRSSGLGEDAFLRSLAGKFKSLTIPGKHRLNYGILEVYGNFLALRDSVDDKIAVILQKFINADSGGIAFSSLLGMTTIEAVVGDPEKAVEGGNSAIIDMDGDDIDDINYGFQESPQEVIIHGKVYDGSYRTKNIWKRKTHVVNTKSSGKRRSPLTEKQIKRVAKVVRALEKEFGYPIDIEFAFKGNKLYLLQARPITGNKQHSVKLLPEFTEEDVICKVPIAVNAIDHTGRLAIVDHDTSSKKEDRFRQLLKRFGKGLILVSHLPENMSAVTTSVNVMIDHTEASRIDHKELILREESKTAYLGCPGVLPVLESKLDFQVIGESWTTWDGRFCAYARISKEPVRVISNGLRAIIVKADAKPLPRAEPARASSAGSDFDTIANALVKAREIAQRIKQLGRSYEGAGKDLTQLSVEVDKAADNIKRARKLSPRNEALLKLIANNVYMFSADRPDDILKDVDTSIGPLSYITTYENLREAISASRESKGTDLEASLFLTASVLISLSDIEPIGPESKLAPGDIIYFPENQFISERIGILAAYGSVEYPDGRTWNTRAGFFKEKLGAGKLYRLIPKPSLDVADIYPTLDGIQKAPSRQKGFLSPRYLIAGSVLGFIVGCFTLFGSGLPLGALLAVSAGISAIAALFGWGVHSLAHIISGDMKKPDAYDRHWGPIASFFLFLVAFEILLFSPYSVFLGLPFYAIFSVSAANFITHIFDDDMSIFTLYAKDRPKNRIKHFVNFVLLQFFIIGLSYFWTTIAGESGAVEEFTRHRGDTLDEIIRMGKVISVTAYWTLGGLAALAVLVPTWRAFKRLMGIKALDSPRGTIIPTKLQSETDHMSTIVGVPFTDSAFTGMIIQFVPKGLWRNMSTPYFINILANFTDLNLKYARRYRMFNYPTGLRVFAINNLAHTLNTLGIIARRHPFFASELRRDFKNWEKRCKSMKKIPELENRARYLLNVMLAAEDPNFKIPPKSASRPSSAGSNNTSYTASIIKIAVTTAVIAALMNSSAIIALYVTVGIYALIFGWLFRIKHRLKGKEPVSLLEKITYSFYNWDNSKGASLSKISRLSVIKIIIALGVAFTSAPSWLTALWFIINITRNYTSDQISNRLEAKRWNPKYVKPTKMANSIFFTGIVLPFIYSVKGIFESWFPGSMIAEMLIVGTVGGIYAFCQRLLRDYPIKDSFLQALGNAYISTGVATSIFSAKTTQFAGRMSYLLTRKGVLEVIALFTDTRKQRRKLREESARASSNIAGSARDKRRKGGFVEKEYLTYIIIGISSLLAITLIPAIVIYFVKRSKRRARRRVLSGDRTPNRRRSNRSIRPAIRPKVAPQAARPSVDVNGIIDKSSLAQLAARHIDRKRARKQAVSAGNLHKLHIKGTDINVELDLSNNSVKATHTLTGRPLSPEEIKRYGPTLKRKLQSLKKSHGIEARSSSAGWRNNICLEQIQGDVFHTFSVMAAQCQGRGDKFSPVEFERVSDMYGEMMHTSELYRDEFNAILSQRLENPIPDDIINRLNKLDEYDEGWYRYGASDRSPIFAGGYTADKIIPHIKCQIEILMKSKNKGGFRFVRFPAITESRYDHLFGFNYEVPHLSADNVFSEPTIGLCDELIGYLQYLDNKNSQEERETHLLLEAIVQLALQGSFFTKKEANIISRYLFPENYPDDEEIEEKGGLLNVALEKLLRLEEAIGYLARPQRKGWPFDRHAAFGTIGPNTYESDLDYLPFYKKILKAMLEFSFSPFHPDLTSDEISQWFYYMLGTTDELAIACMWAWANIKTIDDNTVLQPYFQDDAKGLRYFNDLRIRRNEHRKEDETRHLSPSERAEIILKVIKYAKQMRWSFDPSNVKGNVYAAIKLLPYMSDIGLDSLMPIFYELDEVLDRELYKQEVYPDSLLEKPLVILKMYRNFARLKPYLKLPEASIAHIRRIKEDERGVVKEKLGGIATEIVEMIDSRSRASSAGDSTDGQSTLADIEEDLGSSDTDDIRQLLSKIGYGTNEITAVLAKFSKTDADAFRQTRDKFNLFRLLKNGYAYIKRKDDHYLVTLRREKENGTTIKHMCIDLFLIQGKEFKHIGYRDIDIYAIINQAQGSGIRQQYIRPPAFTEATEKFFKAMDMQKPDFAKLIRNIEGFWLSEGYRGRGLGTLINKITLGVLYFTTGYNIEQLMIVNIGDDNLKWHVSQGAVQRGDAVFYKKYFNRQFTHFNCMKELDVIPSDRGERSSSAGKGSSKIQESSKELQKEFRQFIRTGLEEKGAKKDVIMRTDVRAELRIFSGCYVVRLKGYAKKLVKVTAERINRDYITVTISNPHTGEVIYEGSYLYSYNRPRKKSLTMNQHILSLRSHYRLWLTHENNTRPAVPLKMNRYGEFAAYAFLAKDPKTGKYRLPVVVYIPSEFNFNRDGELIDRTYYGRAGVKDGERVLSVYLNPEDRGEYKAINVCTFEEPNKLISIYDPLLTQGTNSWYREVAKGEIVTSERVQVPKEVRRHQDHTVIPMWNDTEKGDKGYYVNASVGYSFKPGDIVWQNNVPEEPARIEFCKKRGHVSPASPKHYQAERVCYFLNPDTGSVHAATHELSRRAEAFFTGDSNTAIPNSIIVKYPKTGLSICRIAGRENRLKIWGRREEKMLFVFCTDKKHNRGIKIYLVDNLNRPYAKMTECYYSKDGTIAWKDSHAPEYLGDKEKADMAAIVWNLGYSPTPFKSVGTEETAGIIGLNDFIEKFLVSENSLEKFLITAQKALLAETIRACGGNLRDVRKFLGIDGLAKKAAIYEIDLRDHKYVEKGSYAVMGSDIRLPAGGIEMRRFIRIVRAAYIQRVLEKATRNKKRARKMIGAGIEEFNYGLRFLGLRPAERPRKLKKVALLQKHIDTFKRYSRNPHTFGLVKAQMYFYEHFKGEKIKKLAEMLDSRHSDLETAMTNIAIIYILSIMSKGHRASVEKDVLPFLSYTCPVQDILNRAVGEYMHSIGKKSKHRTVGIKTARKRTVAKKPRKTASLVTPARRYAGAMYRAALKGKIGFLGSAERMLEAMKEANDSSDLGIRALSDLKAQFEEACEQYKLFYKYAFHRNVPAAELETMKKITTELEALKQDIFSRPLKAVQVPSDKLPAADAKDRSSSAGITAELDSAA